jgi:carboxyl-terminal processing protease
MNLNKAYIRICLFLIFIIISFTKSYSQNDIYCKHANAVFKTIASKHFNPIVPDEKWSEDLFYLFLKTLDPQGMLFLKEDYLKISKYKTSLNDYVLNCHGNFIADVCKFYKQRLSETDSLVDLITQKPFNFNLNDTLNFSDDSIFNLNTVDEKAQKWRKLLKYRTLNYLFTSSGDTPVINDLLAKEVFARELIKRKQIQRISRLLNPPMGLAQSVSEQFFNAIALSFDPHSAYFSNNEKKTFESDLSTEKLTYGLEIDETDLGEIQIIRILPGGPAWKSKALNKGDILLKAQWGNLEPYDLSLMDCDELEDLFDSEDIKMNLTVRKANGQIKTVPLIKEEIATDENSIKSLVLKGNSNIGYINLPGFYTEWDDNSTAGCSIDMAREILKLRKENIEGLIIDLRFNGGGAISEAISLAGIFINEGPLSIIQYNNQKPVVIKDFNRGTIYEGPIVILVNEYSASASEIIASTLQDYNRAIIVGSPTFGKASSQIVIPVEKTNYLSNNDFVKITTGKIYRITGKSYQGLGIMPDIKLPGYFEFDKREAEFSHAFSPDSINKKVIYPTLPKFPMEYLNQNSAKRIESNASFNKIINFNNTIGKTISQKDIIPLNINTYKNTEWQNYKTIKTLDSIVHIKTSTYLVSNNNYDKQVFKLDNYKQEMNNELINNVETDIYIEECYNIISDLLKYYNQ